MRWGSTPFGSCSSRALPCTALSNAMLLPPPLGSPAGSSREKALFKAARPAAPSDPFPREATEMSL